MVESRASDKTCYRIVKRPLFSYRRYLSRYPFRRPTSSRPAEPALTNIVTHAYQPSFLAEFGSAVGTVPFDSPSRRFRQAYTFEVKPFLFALAVFAANHVSPADIAAEAVARFVRIDLIACCLFLQPRLLFLRFGISLGRLPSHAGSDCCGLLFRCCLTLSNADCWAAFLVFGNGPWCRSLTTSAGCCPHRIRGSRCGALPRKLFASGSYGR